MTTTTTEAPTTTTTDSEKVDCSAETYATEAEAQACDLSGNGAAHAMGDKFMPGAAHTFEAPFAQFDPAVHCTPVDSIGDPAFDKGYGYGIAEMLQRCACNKTSADDPASTQTGQDRMVDQMVGRMVDLGQDMSWAYWGGDRKRRYSPLPYSPYTTGAEVTMMDMKMATMNTQTGIAKLCENNNCETFPLFNPSDDQHCERLLQLATTSCADKTVMNLQQLDPWEANAAESIECPTSNDASSEKAPNADTGYSYVPRKRRLAARVDKFPAFMMQMHDAYGRGTGYFEYNRATARFTSRTIPDGELYYQLDAGTAHNFLNGISSKPIFVTRGGPDATSPTVKGRFHMPLPGDVNHYRITKTDSDMPLSTNEVMFSMAVDHTWHVEHCRSMVSNGPPKGEVDGAEPLAERLRHFTHCTSVVEAGTK